ncbi:MAG: bacillithiol biosynthesis cysteine-adding enzyme BshC [Flavobacteriales bacterium]|nr:bacillithiol biosynthesis cysteine-adding enzyme BshC [Flavobacteriales bacterium]
MTVARVPYAETGRFSKAVLDHLSDAPEIRGLRDHAPDLPSLVRAAHARAFDPAHRAVLVERLRAQYEGLEQGDAVQRNIERLAQPDALTVTTGHQLCLFGGPMYLPFKVLNTVSLAERCTQELGRPVVPVFWMASEDHDREEIDHTFLNGERITWPGQPRGAVGRLRLQGVEQSLEELDAAIGPAPFGPELLDLARSCYRSERTLGQATQAFIHGLFGHHGVLIIDGDDPALKRFFVPVMEQDLLHGVTHRAVEHANAVLSEHYKVQAHVRPIDLFYLHQDRRSRIEQEGDHYRVLDGGPVFTAAELLVEVRNHPERFSPNVLLRPLYQETILPNIAYIGGGGELAYWFQLKWVFQALQIPMPVLMLRTSAGFLSEKHEQQWASLGLKVSDLFADRSALRTRVALERAGARTDVEQEARTLQQLFDALASRMKQIDPTLEASARSAQARSERVLDGLQHKMERAVRRKESEALARLDKVLDAFIPGGQLQERRENLLAEWSRSGPALFDVLLRELDPLDQRFTVFVGDPVRGE